VISHPAEPPMTGPVRLESADTPVEALIVVP
jgi:hypothetical protein